MAHGKAERPGELRLGDANGALVIVSPPGEEFELAVEEPVESKHYGSGRVRAVWRPSDRGTALALVAGILRRLGAVEGRVPSRPLDDALAAVLNEEEDDRNARDDLKVAAFREVLVRAGQERAGVVRDTPPPAWDSLDLGQRADWRARYADTMEAVAAARAADERDRGRR